MTEETTEAKETSRRHTPRPFGRGLVPVWSVPIRHDRRLALTSGPMTLTPSLSKSLMTMPSSRTEAPPDPEGFLTSSPLHLWQERPLSSIVNPPSTTTPLAVIGGRGVTGVIVGTSAESIANSILHRKTGWQRSD